MREKSVRRNRVPLAACPPGSREFTRTHCRRGRKCYPSHGRDRRGVSYYLTTWPFRERLHEAATSRPAGCGNRSENRPSEKSTLGYFRLVKKASSLAR